MTVSKRLAASATLVGDHTACRADWGSLAGLKQSDLGFEGIPHTMNDMHAEKSVVLKSN